MPEYCIFLVNIFPCALTAIDIDTRPCPHHFWCIRRSSLALVPPRAKYDSISPDPENGIEKSCNLLLICKINRPPGAECGGVGIFPVHVATVLNFPRGVTLVGEIHMHCQRTLMHNLNNLKCIISKWQKAISKLYKSNKWMSVGSGVELAYRAVLSGLSLSHLSRPNWWMSLSFSCNYDYSALDNSWH